MAVKLRIYAGKIRATPGLLPWAGFGAWMYVILHLLAASKNIALL